MSALLQPCQLGALALKNRVVMAPLTRCRADNPGFVPNDLMRQYYVQRAGAGLIISEGAIVSPQGRGYPYTPGIWSEAQVAGWRNITDAVHEAGGLMVCQLWHCGRLSLPALQEGGATPVAPSAINPQWKMFTADGLQETVTPQALSREAIAGVVQDFARAARNAVAAGFDGVEIHSSNGYLFHQFFAQSANTRADAYGGNHENRARIFFEVLDAIGQHLPMDRVGFRLNPMLNRFHGLDVDADTIPQWEYVVRQANRYGLAYLHLTEPLHPKQIAGNPHTLADVGAHFRPIAQMPIITNGALDQTKGETRLQAKLADAVAYGQAWIANPDLVERFAHGWPVAKADAETFYQGGARGYVDYPGYSG